MKILLKSLSLKLALVVFVCSLPTVRPFYLFQITTLSLLFYPVGIYTKDIPSTKLKKDATIVALKSDSLTNALKKNEAYIQSHSKES
jgi:hypothetical protein